MPALLKVFVMMENGSSELLCVEEAEFVIKAASNWFSSEVGLLEPVVLPVVLPAVPSVEESVPEVLEPELMW